MNDFSIVSCEPDELRALISLLKGADAQSHAIKDPGDSDHPSVLGDARPKQRDNVDLELFRLCGTLLCSGQAAVADGRTTISEVCPAESGLKDKLWPMKTARFAAVVEVAGSPHTHLPLVAPEKDKVLQAAIKTHRVMTVHRALVGNKADHGTVGFEPGRARQFLIFPKSILEFKEIRIVAVKYDLLDNRAQKAPAKPAKAPKKAAPAPIFHEEKAKRQEPTQGKVVHFTKPEPQQELEVENEAIQGIKNEVRHAMEVLEQGKQVAAFNLLKRIVDS